ncbi:hypothetical protein [Streptomyces sp. CBMA123]|uniref:hypothetical protein n=1 Tax=Streptomyces sp. CBMA123 TaxID=1896313 RepID=UPI0016619F2A|nr:hypothetical protein [Streptomyces sp. CBMA123]MBD0695874.1 hypothetical protein [Streptomyces sp. CBMA123]
MVPGTAVAGWSTRTASPDAQKNHRPAAGARPEPNRPAYLHHLPGTSGVLPGYGHRRPRAG